MAIEQTISNFPDAPNSATDTPQAFNIKANNFVSHQANVYVGEVNNWATQANSVQSDINTKASQVAADASQVASDKLVAQQSATDAQNSADAAQQSATDAQNSADGVDADNIIHTSGSGLPNELDKSVAPYIRGFKNLIINGSFDVWQRGTSYTYNSGTNGYKTADRMYSGNQTDGEFTISKSEIEGSNSIKFEVNTAVSDLTGKNYWYGFRYAFEGQDLYTLAKQGKTLTLSFLFNSNVVGEYPVCFRNLTDSTANAESYTTTFNYTTANTAQKVEVQIPLNHSFSPALLNNADSGIEFTIGFLNQESYSTDVTDTWQDGDYLTTSDCVNWAATANNFIEIAELQLEEGLVATPFEQRPYGLELSLCQRYYEYMKIYPNYENVDAARSTVYFKVTKRAIPSVVVLRDSSVTAQPIALISDTVLSYIPDGKSQGTYFYIDAEL